MTEAGKRKGKKKRDRRREPPSSAAEEQAAEASEEAEAEASAEEPAVELIEVAAADYQRLQEKLQEVVELNLRQKADFDNIRKRLRREVDEAGHRAVAEFVRPFLVELDNFRLAIEHASPDRFDEFAAGVGMIRDNLEGILAQSGVEQIPTEGVFDPAVHEVTAEIESPEPRGTILHVQRIGYRIDGLVIRAAQVIVAKGPAPESESESELESEFESEPESEPEPAADEEEA